MRLLTLRKLRRSSREKLFIIPYLFTFANALWGFLSVIKALEGDCVTAGYCIMMAALMDLLDGRLARAFGSSSHLGGELDSLCDAVSFCFAPTIVLYSWCFAQLGTVGTTVLVMYLCAGLFRLAKFNICSWAQYQFFSGLPTPVAALCIASLVINATILGSTTFLSWFVTNHGLLITVALLAYAMISPLQFPSFKKMRLHSWLTSCTICSIFVFVFLSLMYDLPLGFLGLLFYIIGSVAWNIYRIGKSYTCLS